MLQKLIQSGAVLSVNTFISKPILNSAFSRIFERYKLVHLKQFRSINHLKFNMDNPERSSVMRVVPTTENGVLTRVIGSTDIRGSGTDHKISSINPFVLLDEAALISKKNIPPFGLHPHSGAMILTIVLSGFVESINYDKEGKEESSIHGPGPCLLAVNAGRGIVHDEHTSSEVPTKLIQLAWMTGDAESDFEIASVDHPMVLNEENGTEVMLCAGTFRGKTAAIECKQNSSVTVLVVKLPAGNVFETDELGEGNTNAFVFSINKGGPLLVNNDPVPASHVADIEKQFGKLSIKNKSNDSVDVLVGYGQPLKPEWKKLLMFNGFIFARSEEDAQKKEDEFREVGAPKFGQKL